MATMCPKCEKESLKKGENMVYCAGYKSKKKDDGKWINEGTCDFHIGFSNKVWGGSLTPEDIKKMVNGETLKNKKGDKMSLDLGSEFFTKIEFAPKVEDADL